MKIEHKLQYEEYNNIDELNAFDAELLREARKVTEKAYAPYSQFMVGAVGVLRSGEKIYGSNQENASYPVGICAERVLLASAAVTHADEPIETIAISYNNLSGRGTSDRPVSPCGMCRQSLAEYEERTNKHIRLILSGMEGKVIILNKAADLLPLSFGGKDLG